MLMLSQSQIHSTVGQLKSPQIKMTSLNFGLIKLKKLLKTVENFSKTSILLQGGIYKQHTNNVTSKLILTKTTSTASEPGMCSSSLGKVDLTAIKTPPPLEHTLVLGDLSHL